MTLETKEKATEIFSTEKELTDGNTTTIINGTDKR
jgi:hypothetical protein